MLKNKIGDFTERLRASVSEFLQAVAEDVSKKGSDELNPTDYIIEPLEPFNPATLPMNEILETLKSLDDSRDKEPIEKVPNQMTQWKVFGYILPGIPSKGSVNGKICQFIIDSEYNKGVIRDCAKLVKLYKQNQIDFARGLVSEQKKIYDEQFTDGILKFL